jgi:two-component system, NarL family, response regulator
MCADDHSLVRKGVAAIIATEPDMELVAEATNGRQAVELFLANTPDVMLMDLRLPVMNGVEAAREILCACPEAKIIALTMYCGDDDIRLALEAGVRGYLLKEMVHREVLDAIKAVHAGNRVIPAAIAARVKENVLQHALTQREIEVLKTLATGMSNRRIAEILGIAEGTIKMHIQNILTKLGAIDRTQAVTIGLTRGIIHLDEITRKLARGFSTTP